MPGDRILASQEPRPIQRFVDSNFSELQVDFGLRVSCGAIPDFKGQMSRFSNDQSASPDARKVLECRFRAEANLHRKQEVAFRRYGVRRQLERKPNHVASLCREQLPVAGGGRVRIRPVRAVSMVDANLRSRPSIRLRRPMSLLIYKNGGWRNPLAAFPQWRQRPIGDLLIRT